MTHLSALKFTTLSKSDVYNPALIRRKRLVERLEEQKLLAADQSYIPVEKRWRKNPDGSRSIVDHYRRIKPWWRVEPDGKVVLTVRSGLKVVEFEKGKAGILIGSMDLIESVLDTLITAAKAGELDSHLYVSREAKQQPLPKPKKVV